MNRRWFVNRTNPEFVSYISKSASVSPVLAQILINRGIKKADDINDFLNPAVANLSDPFELQDMRPAVERIKNALKNNERIFIHGDYDADGITATSILLQALKTAGADAHYFIPNRIIHGYGFNSPSVDIAKKLGAGLIITVDCGVSSLEAAAYAKTQGIDVIITDHHEPFRQTDTDDILISESRQKFLLPDATAIITPHIGNSNPKMTHLSGAGLALKLAQALSIDGSLPFTADDFLSLTDLASIGTIADVVSLTGENRNIIKTGLQYINSSLRPGIKALKELSGRRDKEMKSYDLAFTIIPRINAAGRIDDANDVVRLFLTASEEEAFLMADRLNSINSKRQQIEENVYQEALSQLNKNGYDKAIVLYGRDWHIGVIGIVAARIAEEFYRPTFIFNVEDGIAKGSARSIPPFNIYTGLRECRDILISFGGHKQAAGIKLKASDLSLFTKTINGIVKEDLIAEAFIPTVEIDAEVSLSDINPGIIRELSMLEPFGYGNSEPLLGAKDLSILNPRLVGKNHLKLKLKQGSMSIDAIGFAMGSSLGSITESAYMDAAFTPAINEWNGGRYLQLRLKALRCSN